MKIMDKRTITFRISGVVLLILPMLLPVIYMTAPSFVSLMYLLLVGDAILFIGALSNRSDEVEPKSQRELSLDVCEQAFLNLQEWTRVTGITEGNFDYHKQMVVELDELIERHLERYPADRELPRFRLYAWYIGRSYDFTIKRW